MWFLFLLLAWLLCEYNHYKHHHRLVTKWRRSRRLSAPIRDSWNAKYQDSIPDVPLHNYLASGLSRYEDGSESVLQPHYKPVLYYSLLRGLHETSFAYAKYCGWSCRSLEGVWFWERGTGCTVLFLHGFGFGPYAYGSVLHDLSYTHRVIAPQYPGLSYDGRVDIPSIQDYADVICRYTEGESYSIVSNSFGTIVHHAILRKLGTDALCKIQRQIYVEPVCFYPYAGQLFTFVASTLWTCFKADTWRGRMMATLSYLLVAKDRSTLYLCQQILEDPKWDGEIYLSSIPTTIILSEHDALIRVPELRSYFQQRHPSCQLIVMTNAYHGEALFSSQLKIRSLLISQDKE